MVGFPHPRLTASLRPISLSSSSEYEPLQPQSGPSAWQHPASAMVWPVGMTVNCLATPAYLDRTASRTSPIGPFAPLNLRSMNVDGCILSHPSTNVDGFQYHSSHDRERTPSGAAARRVLRAAGGGCDVGGRDCRAHESSW